MGGSCKIVELLQAIYSSVKSCVRTNTSNNVNVCVFVYVIVFNYVNLCTSHNNKPFTYIHVTHRVSVKCVWPYTLLSYYCPIDVNN